MGISQLELMRQLEENITQTTSELNVTVDLDPPRYDSATTSKD